MAIEHASIPDDGLHEPKGVANAAADRVYVADGASSGSWAQVDANLIKGTVNNGSAANQRVITDGAGGFDLETEFIPSYAMMNLTDNLTAQSFTAATDLTLATNSDYEEIVLPFTFNNVKNVTTGPNYLQIDNPGTYQIDFWANAKSSVNATTLAVKFVVNDTSFVSRRPKLRLPSIGEYSNFSGSGIHTFAAGEQVKLYLASDKTADITIEDLTSSLNLIKAS